MLGTELSQCCGQALTDSCLAGSCRPHQHDAMPHEVRLVQLDALVEPSSVQLQVPLFDDLHQHTTSQNVYESMPATNAIIGQLSFATEPWRQD